MWLEKSLQLSPLCWISLFIFFNFLFFCCFVHYFFNYLNSLSLSLLNFVCWISRAVALPNCHTHRHSQVSLFFWNDYFLPFPLSSNSQYHLSPFSFSLLAVGLALENDLKSLQTYLHQWPHILCFLVVTVNIPLGSYHRHRLCTGPLLLACSMSSPAMIPFLCISTVPLSTRSFLSIQAWGHSS